MRQCYKVLLFSIVMFVLSIAAGANLIAADFRPPSVPLVSCDPYFSIWSNADALTDDVTRHWTGRPHPMVSLVRIDGKAYRLMGNEPEGLDALEQTSCEVRPTQTIYTFKGEGVSISMTFLQGAVPDDIDLMSRPVVYLTWKVSSTDSKAHDVSIYFDAGMELVVNDDGQQVVWGREKVDGLEVLRAGCEEQNVLGRKGDNVRIDWGHFYLAASNKAKPASSIAQAGKSRMLFVEKDRVLSGMDESMPRKVSDDAPVMAMKFDLGSIHGSSTKSCKVVLAYDDLYSVLYFGQKLEAYWKRDGVTINQLLTESFAQYDEISRRAEKFDRKLMGDLRRAGGENYQLIGSLAYRQALGANKIVADKKGMPLMFSKENFSNGCMGTVDVFYPFAPQVLLLNPTLAKASFVPILEYGRSERWKFPFAPHDIGTYPHAMGQAYGGGERTEDNQMPVEECGNMILLVAAVVEAENDVAFARAYWDVLTTWADYLKSKGLDPENQLCTDDFAGHLAHNVNLSLKAIVALGAYAKMADRMGESETAAEFRKTAKQYVKQWMQMADDGDHYRLAFDREGTWSQKYNLIWDRVLGLNLFPASVAAKEMAYYKRVQNTYGLPLDNRSDYTKLDWILWTASITGKQADFEALIAPVVKFLNETPNRIPMTDWYWTHNARHRGFQARPVVGGVFIRLMDDRKVWRKWVSKADKVTGKWSPIPKPPKIVKVVETSIEEPQQWYYVFEEPAKGWFKSDINDTSVGWQKGKGGFGTADTPGAVVRTQWGTSDIWMHRTFSMDKVAKDLQLYIHHDEGAQVYINGELAVELTGFTTDYQPVAISEKAYKTLRQGKNTIAIHCHQTGGGQYIDAGLVQVIEQQ